MVSYHESGVICFTLMIPPAVSDADIQAAVDEYKTGLSGLAAVGAPTSTATDIMSLGGRGVVQPGGEDAVPLWITRSEPQQAAHLLTIIAPEAFHDLLLHELAAKVAIVAGPPQGYRKLDSYEPVPARKLGLAIGPQGTAIKAVHHGARLCWDSARPFAGTYACFIPVGRP